MGGSPKRSQSSRWRVLRLSSCSGQWRRYQLFSCVAHAFDQGLNVCNRYFNQARLSITNKGWIAPLQDSCHLNILIVERCLYKIFTQASFEAEVWSYTRSLSYRKSWSHLTRICSLTWFFYRFTTGYRMFYMLRELEQQKGMRQSHCFASCPGHYKERCLILITWYGQ